MCACQHAEVSMQKVLFGNVQLCRNGYSFYILFLLPCLFSSTYKKKNLDFVMWVFPKVAKTRMMSSVKLPRHCVWGACLVWAPLRSEAEALTDNLGLHSRVPF